jgi:hypothetical protein
MGNAGRGLSRHMLAVNGGGIDRFCNMSMRSKTTVSLRTSQTCQEGFPSQWFLAPGPPLNIWLSHDSRESGWWGCNISPSAAPPFGILHTRNWWIKLGPGETEGFVET